MNSAAVTLCIRTVDTVTWRARQAFRSPLPGSTRRVLAKLLRSTRLKSYSGVVERVVAEVVVVERETLSLELANTIVDTR